MFFLRFSSIAYVDGEHQRTICTSGIVTPKGTLAVHDLVCKPVSELLFLSTCCHVHTSKVVIPSAQMSLSLDLSEDFHGNNSGAHHRRVSSWCVAYVSLLWGKKYKYPKSVILAYPFESIITFRCSNISTLHNPSDDTGIPTLLRSPCTMPSWWRWQTPLTTCRT